MRTPPTMHDLLTDDRYSRYIAKAPKLPPSLQWGKPYMVLGIKHSGVWSRALRVDYPSAFGTFNALLENDEYADVTIVSRRRILREPYWHGVPGFDWCGRCRRPTIYRVHNSHPALKGAPVIMEGVARCWYCGISRELGCAPRAPKPIKKKDK